MSSIPEGKLFIVHGAVVWKLGWEDVDWMLSIVIYPLGFKFPPKINLFYFTNLAYLFVLCSNLGP